MSIHLQWQSLVCFLSSTMVSPTPKNLYSLIFFNSITPISKDLKEYLSANMKSHSFKKGELICQAGEPFSHLHLIKKGLVRGFYQHGPKEITQWVDWENHVFTSVGGFFMRTPCKENIQAIEATQTESLHFADLQYCLKHFPDMSTIYRALFEFYLVSAEERVYISRIPSAKDRYEAFLASGYAESISRIPNKYIAEFLGIRPETLSRLAQDYQAIPQ